MPKKIRSLNLSKINPMRIILAIVAVFVFASCATKTEKNDYLSYSKEDKFTGGVKMIPIKTPKGTFNVWTKRVGNNPKIKVLLLHGGPGGTHEAFECFDGWLPAEGIEYIYYDQLESAYSDQPNDSSLWTIDHFVEEVEQVRQALGLNKDNFYLLGHSWGGILAMEYALKYQQNMKGLIISNMMSSIPAYNKYAQEVLGPKLDPAVLKQIKDFEAKGDFSNPKYEELVVNNYYTEHVLRMAPAQWPDPIMRMFKHLSKGIYISMQGYSEFGITGDASLKTWDRSNDLKNITIPTLVIGATHDTMDPVHMEWMSKQMNKGSFLLCPNGSHCAMWDDQETYMKGLITFLKKGDQ